MIQKLLPLFLSLLLMSCESVSHMNSTTVIAHRGGALLRNENTLSAFEHAIELQCDYIELDVHLSKDGELIVCHDPRIDRTTNGSGAIEDMTLDEIRRYRISDFRSHQSTDEWLPTLSEVLALVDHRCRILLEIKRSREDQYPGIEQKVVQMLRDYAPQSEYIVQSFDNRVIETIHELDSTIRVEKLLFCMLPGGKCFDGHFSRFSVQSHPYCRSVNICWLFAGKRLVRSLHEQGVEVKVWTVNRWSQVPEGADAVITNRPDLFLTR